MDDSGHIFPTHPSFDFTVTIIKIIDGDVFTAHSDLNPQIAYGAEAAYLIVLEKVCFSADTLPSQAFLSLSSFLQEVWLSTAFLKRLRSLTL